MNFKYYLKRKYDMFLNNTINRENVRHFRKVLQYDINMNLIKIWNSQKEISDTLLCSESNLNKYLKNDSKRGTFRNHIWKYE